MKAKKNQNPYDAFLAHIAVEVEKIIESKMSEYIDRNTPKGKKGEYIPIAKLAKDLGVCNGTLLNWAKSPGSEVKAYTLANGLCRNETYFKKHEIEAAMKERYKTNLNHDA